MTETVNPAPVTDATLPGDDFLVKAENQGKRHGIAGLVDTLYGLSLNRQNRATLMGLRSVLSRPDIFSHEAVPVVAPFLPSASSATDSRQRRREDMGRRNYYLIAGLFASWHINHRSDLEADVKVFNLGHSLALLSQRQPTAGKALINDLTRMPVNQCTGLLMRIVQQLSQENIRINWYDLGYALTRPGNWRESQRKWAESYHRSASRKK